MLTLRQIQQALLVKSFERSDVEKASLARKPLTVRVSRGVGVDGPQTFQIFPHEATDGTNRTVIHWVIPSSIGDIDVTENVVA